MSAVNPVQADTTTAPVVPAVVSVPPGRRIWLRFKSNRRGYWSLIIFSILFGISLIAEVVSNDKPLVVRYNGEWMFPMVTTYSEKAFGGDFETPADYLDPFIQEQFEKDGNFAIYPINRYSYDTLNYFAPEPNPAPPSAENWLGTDDRGRDVFARLLYGFRISVLFGLALTITGVILGMVTGAIQGYFAGRTDLFFQRFMEIWGSMPELYLLIIFASIFQPSLLLLLVLLSLFGWMGLSDYVRAEFLRNRNLEYVQAARALGFRSVLWGANQRRTNLPGSDPFDTTRLKNDFIWRLPGGGRRSLLGLYFEKATRRVSGIAPY